MTSSLPPTGPGGPEYLDVGSGEPLRPTREPRTAGRRRTRWLVGGVAGVLLVGGAAAWAATSFLATGPQPAEALPASTIGYASIDLDPSGGQKIAALRTLRKFPAFKDEVGLDAGDDVRRRVFEELQSTDTCRDLDYGDDVEPWLGNRMAVAAVDTGGENPNLVVVLQVSDEDAADAGLRKLRECSAADGAWSMRDGWAVLAESQEVADGVVADAEDAPLSDDERFRQWTDEAGDPGIATAYVAPAAARYLGSDGILGLSGEMPDAELDKALADFEGMAATVRFDGGSLELEMATGAGDSQRALKGSDGGDDVLTTLPEDTAIAFGMGFTDGWFGEALGGSRDLLDQMAASTGLDLPADLETLAGESAALAVGSDADIDTLFGSSQDSDVPVGLKVQGDPEDIESVLAKIRPRLGPGASYVDTDSRGDVVAIGPDADYRATLLEDGELGSSEVFRNAVREPGDAAAIFFVDFDAGDWLARAVAGDREAQENTEPLEGLGISGWVDGEASHLVLRVTTD